jgi:hypothetical protein
MGLVRNCSGKHGFSRKGWSEEEVADSLMNNVMLPNNAFFATSLCKFTISAPNFFQDKNWLLVLLTAKSYNILAKPLIDALRLIKYHPHVHNGVTFASLVNALSFLWEDDGQRKKNASRHHGICYW